MALDPTSREANIRDSCKKFYVDNFETTSGLVVTFDKGLNFPRLSGQPMTVNKWVNIDFGSLDTSAMSLFLNQIYCCARQDREGFKLAQLRDTVMGYLTDSGGLYTDNMARIPFYRSYENQAWTSLGGMVIQEIAESGQMDAPDETKYKVLTVTIRFASK